MSTTRRDVIVRIEQQIDDVTREHARYVLEVKRAEEILVRLRQHLTRVKEGEQ